MNQRDPNWSRRRMPKIEEIRAYWGFDGFWLAHGVEPAFRANPETCMACGWYGETRCHIMPRHQGGSDDASNLHILCPVCHDDSEWLSGDPYWRWLAQVDGAQTIRRVVVRCGVSWDKMASVNLQLTDDSTRKAYQDAVALFGSQSIDSGEFLRLLDRAGIDIRL